jgi:hypothetical protein
MFMRLRRTVPQFTFTLSGRFVNRKSLVSTGFFRFFPVLFEFGYILPQKTQQNDRFLATTALSTQADLALEKTFLAQNDSATNFHVPFAIGEFHIRLAVLGIHTASKEKPNATQIIPTGPSVSHCTN